jgi:hypothetical protein
MSAAVASDGNSSLFALTRNTCSSAKVPVGVSRSEDLSLICANRLTSGSLLGLRRATTFHARVTVCINGRAQLALDHVAIRVILLDD